MVRIKNRYVVFNVIYPIDETAESLEAALKTKSGSLSLIHQPPAIAITPKVVVQAIRQSLQTNFGDYGNGVGGGVLTVKYFSEKSSLGIIKVSRESTRLVCAAIMLITRLQASPVTIRVLRVSGSVKKAEEMLIKRGKGLSIILSKNSVGQSLDSLFDQDVHIEKDSDEEQ
ncbi:unnamed protein product [Kuraishia capsulata CBS 1993]|uniref:Ribonuclease P/MRP protein subunit POP5 n=1 Tax=Kuraishia capsulata CBS 1993 TaxID=1382522 RepID=W6MPU4_9ASCO|nr:uncharacterized protein KUCA_T00003179001 [Kuraishia capsulata CBS 1993]CDK27202.1 unnamed protein product [Kuraishia capsulata CBS 1993]